MAIEGPLRELGIHDVFQLLDLSRKTGTLTVTSELRDNEGTVHFQNGRVVAAAIKSNPHRIGDLLMRAGRVTAAQVAAASAAQSERGDGRRLGEILLDMGAISQKELERQVRLQIEAVIFELLSWREGFFRFEEGPMQGDPMVQIGTEALLMEGARRVERPHAARAVERDGGVVLRDRVLDARLDVSLAQVQRARDVSLVELVALTNVDENARAGSGAHLLRRNLLDGSPCVVEEFAGRLGHDASLPKT